MATLNCSVGIQVGSGLQLSVSRLKDVQVFDRIQVKLDPGDAGTAEVEVALQPSAADRVSLLFITSSVYRDELTYNVSDGAETDSPAMALKEPQLLLGPSVNRLIGNPAAGATKKQRWMSSWHAMRQPEHEEMAPCLRP